ncbi:membrane protein [bacterium]|nr:MAG: membrane protein [bacterium]|tara:strand:- start:2032 stop:3276 length:1245 start_codon:yes stop_codon:yes gene_type:complete
MVEPIFKNDAIVLGILMGILGFVFITSSSKHPFWKKFYKYIPGLLLCYFIPSIFNSLGIISGDSSNLYFVASRYLLPTSLVLLTISIDLHEIKKLGSKALIMFFTGTLGIIIGGPLAIIIVSAVSPDIIGGSGADSVWRGLSTVAGSWIGGGANQAAMKEVFEVNDSIFSAMVAVDVIGANVWMAFLLYGTGINNKIDSWFQADATSINELKDKIEAYQAQILRIPNTSDTVKVLSVGFGITAFAHFGADIIAPTILQNAPWLSRFSLTSSFFWLIVLSTIISVALSFTKARELEGVGASRIGSVFIYILVATIGMKMNVMAVFDNPGLFIIGLIWMAIHAFILIAVAKIIKAPFFFLAVGSQANVGGAASAPVVASAFHPSLAPVGVLLAVLGYAIGTYGAWLCGILMQTVSG